MKYNSKDLINLIQLRDDIDELIEEEMMKYHIYKKEQQREYNRLYYQRKKKIIRQKYFDSVRNFHKCNIQQGDIVVEF